MRSSAARREDGLALPRHEPRPDPVMGLRCHPARLAGGRPPLPAAEPAAFLLFSAKGVNRRSPGLASCPDTQLSQGFRGLSAATTITRARVASRGSRETPAWAGEGRPCDRLARPPLQPAGSRRPKTSADPGVRSASNLNSISMCICIYIEFYVSSDGKPRCPRHCLVSWPGSLWGWH